MAQFQGKPTVEFVATLTITESELRALDALVGYGVDTFIKQFYENLGKSYMQPHENGLRVFLNTIHDQIGPQLGRIDDARDLLTNKQPQSGV